MAEKKRGWRVGSQFYKFYPVDQWRNGDFILAEAITRKTVVELFGNKTSYLTLQNAMLGISMWRQEPELEMDDIVKRVYALQPSHVTEVGFEEADAGPPDKSAAATPAKTPSATSAA